MAELVLFDADRIKEFVFATGRLKEIRGASRLVRLATDAAELRALPALSPAQIIFAEGGSGLLDAPDATSAAALCRALISRYRQLTKGATLTAVHTPYTDVTFPADMQRAARLLQLAKESTVALHQRVQTPFTALCASCGTHPVTSHYGAGPARDALCDRCLAKRAASDALRSANQPSEEIYLHQTVWGQQFLNHLPAPAAVPWQNARLSENLTALATLSRPGNYLALLYADGNGLGELVQRQNSKAAYEQLSRRISRALHNALWDALARHFPTPRGADDYAPFELIALGGDDLILVTVADQALSLAVTISRLFAQYSRSATAPADPTPDDELTLSFGVVIAHPGQPILNLEQQARNLLRNAKQRYPGQAAIDFHIVSTPILHDIAQIREDAYTLRQNGIPTARLTSRPLLTDQLDHLLGHATRFQSGGEEAAFPRNKLHTLYQALFAGEAAAEQEAFFLRSRLNRDQRDKFDAFFAAYDITLRPQDLYAPRLPWGEGDDLRFTPFADLVEIYPFVRPVASTAGQGEE